MSSRTTKVQIPGDSAPSDTQTPSDAGQAQGQPQDQNQGDPYTAGAPGDKTAAEVAAQDELKLAQQRNQELEAELAVLRAGQGKPTSTAKGGAPVDYRKMRSEDVDPTKITAPVLCADGWVVPNVPEKKA